MQRNTILMGEEARLIEQLNGGSYESFTLLYDRWVARLYQFAFKLVKSESIAQDIVQETFTRVWENRRNINPGHSFKSYLFTIAYHRIADEFRLQLRNPLIDSYLSFTSSLTNENTAERNLSMEEFVVRLDKAKEKLTDRQRQVFEMSKEQNLSNAEIEQQMGITNQAVRNLLSAAMKTIRQELEPYAPLLLLFLEL